MIYNFLLISDEVDDFVREISIDSEASFLELQDAILDAVNYSKDQMTSFFICDEEWEKEIEVTLLDMESSYEDDSWIMAETKLSDLVEEEKQHLLFVFDMLTERALFMELHEVIPGKSIDAPTCLRAAGDAPVQVLSFDEADMKVAAVATSDSDLFMDEGFDMTSLSDEGLEDLDIRDSLYDFE